MWREDKLPPELLIGIFGRAINTVYDPWNARPAASLTLTLCSICVTWRTIIAGHKAFWDYIPIGIGSGAGDLAKLFLERSQDNPSIDVVAFARHGSSDSRTWQGVEALQYNIHRVRSLSIFAASTPLQTLLYTVLKHQVPPALVHLSLLSIPYNNYLQRMSFDAIGEKHFGRLCSRLKSLQMNNLWFDFDPCDFPQLEKLTLDVNIGFVSLVSSLLPSAPQLQFLEIRDVPEWGDRERLDPEPARGAKVLRLRHPHSFCRRELEAKTQSIAWDVIDFHLPRNLTAGPKGEVKKNLESLLPYVRTNSLKITSLTLRNNQPEVLGQINAMLQVLPNLHTLTLGDLDLTQSIMSLFIPPPDSSDTLPRFRTLRLMSSQICHIETFKTLISSHPIQRLDLWHCSFELDVGDGSVVRSYGPIRSSPFYGWLCEQVPELYIWTL